MFASVITPVLAIVASPDNALFSHKLLVELYTIRFASSSGEDADIIETSDRRERLKAAVLNTFTIDEPISVVVTVVIYFYTFVNVLEILNNVLAVVACASSLTFPPLTSAVYVTSTPFVNTTPYSKMCAAAEP